MERTCDKILLAALILSAAPFAAVAANKVIYGEDNRKEYFEVPKERQVQADAVVSLWDRSKVSRFHYGDFLLSGRPFSEKVFSRDGEKLCASEPFRDQPIGAECSGTLVGEDLVMTAGHCINDQHDCDEMVVVFDFNIKSRDGKAQSIVPASSVYLCKAIVASMNGPAPQTAAAKTGAAKTLDYAIIRLDRKVTGRAPLPIARKPGLATGSPLYTIGHPVGLPAKIADGASVLNIRKGDPFFEADLDTYGGNSGSGVFNAETGLLEGILSRGRNDFIRTPEGCYSSEIVSGKPEDGGELVTKISLVAGFIPQTDGNSAAPQTPVNIDSSGLKPEYPKGVTWEKLTGR